MGKLSILLISILFITLFVNIALVSGITGSIGNARMILRAETGDKIEKSVLVKNVNNQSVDITLSAGGDLADNIKIIDEEFTLEAGEEKKARFEIKVKEKGTTESKINVQFMPLDDGNGVGLSSTVIVIAKQGEGWFDWGSDDDSEEEDEGNGVNVTPGENASVEEDGNVGIILALSITSLLFIALLVLLIFAYKKIKKPVIKIKKGKTKSKKRVKRNA